VVPDVSHGISHLFHKEYRRFHKVSDHFTFNVFFLSLIDCMSVASISMRSVASIIVTSIA